MYAKKVVVITDNLVPYPLLDWSIPESYVDYVVCVEADRRPQGHRLRHHPDHPGPGGPGDGPASPPGSSKPPAFCKEGFSFQTGAGGASLAAAKFLKDIMLREQIQGSFGLGGITGYMVDMLQAGCFQLAAGCAVL